MNRIVKSGSRTQTSHFQRSVALLLCCSIAAFSGKGFAQVNNANPADRVGRVTGALPAVTKNGGRIGLQDVVQSNDEISTHASGRIGIELRDGTILSAGNATQFRIARHDPQTGETMVNLTMGSLRSRVVRLRHSGQFEIATPHSTIRAMGTDFFVDVSPDRTQLVVYSGVVIVTSASTLPDSTTKLMLDVAAGENVLVSANGITGLQATDTGLEQQTMAQTAIPETAAPAVAEGLVSPGKSSHATRYILIGGLAAGAIVGAVVGLRGSKSQPATSTSTIPPTIPPH
jgi:ferric-dicitrate binding protein FerR (iron transport regulator)